MKHFEIKNLKRNLDALVQYVADNKVTNPYLNYGLIRNSKIIAKAVEVIDEATPAQLKELETKMYQDGLKEFEKLTGKAKTDASKLSEIDKQNKVFSLGFLQSTEEERETRNKLVKEYNDFLSLDNDTVFYNLNFEGLKDINIEIQYWDILDNFIK
jgi:hypothetical protein